jgi:hypothetical protein
MHGRLWGDDTGPLEQLYRPKTMTCQDVNEECHTRLAEQAWDVTRLDGG